MKTAYWIVGLGMALVTAGMIFVIKGGWSEKPDKVLNPTYFENESEIGHVLARRFFVDLNQSKVVVFGVSQHLKQGDVIWSEFIRAAKADAVVFDRIFVHSSLAAKFQGLQVFSSFDEVLPTGRIAVIVPSDEGWWSRVRDRYQGDATLAAFFQTPFTLDLKSVEENPLPCSLNDKSLQFGCLARAAGTRYYRKKLTENRLTAAMDKVQDQLHLLFVQDPR